MSQRIEIAISSNDSNLTEAIRDVLDKRYVTITSSSFIKFHVIIGRIPFPGEQIRFSPFIKVYVQSVIHFVDTKSTEPNALVEVSL